MKSYRQLIVAYLQLLEKGNTHEMPSYLLTVQMLYLLCSGKNRQISSTPVCFVRRGTQQLQRTGYLNHLTMVWRLNSLTSGLWKTVRKYHSSA